MLLELERQMAPLSTSTLFAEVKVSTWSREKAADDELTRKGCKCDPTSQFQRSSAQLPNSHHFPRFEESSPPDSNRRLLL